MTRPLRKLQRRMERHENKCRREHAQLQHDVTAMLALLVPASDEETLRPMTVAEVRRRMNGEPQLMTHTLTVDNRTLRQASEDQAGWIIPQSLRDNLPELR